MATDVLDVFSKLEKGIVRGWILAGEARIDGRDPSTVRQINTRVSVLPRTHGSALFSRGETQALVVTTLGTGRDAQIVDAIEGERREPFMLHYNFLSLLRGRDRTGHRTQAPGNWARAFGQTGGPGRHA